jgi:hypothetical protein
MQMLCTHMPRVGPTAMPGSGTVESGESAVTTGGRCLSRALKGADSAAGVTVRGWLVAESSCSCPHLAANASSRAASYDRARGRWWMGRPARNSRLVRIDAARWLGRICL